LREFHDDVVAIDRMDGAATLRSDARRCAWTVQRGGGTRTISWTAGSDRVTINDTTASGSDQTIVPIGHELPLIPFR
jgi:hypothetical protein